MKKRFSVLWSLPFRSLLLLGLMAALPGWAGPAAPAQSPATLKLLAAPLTVSDRPKVWPKEPLRGINMAMMTPKAANSVNPGSYLTDAEFRRLREWGVNVLRMPIDVDRGSPWDVKKGGTVPPIPASDPVAPYRKHLEALKVALQLGEKYHIYIIPAAGNVVGRKIDVLYHDSDGAGYQRTLLDLWTWVAREYGRHPMLLGYDLLNEPHSASELKSWQTETMPALSRAIRAIDRNTYLIVEPGPWGLPEGFKALKPLDDPKTVYSFHFYYPHNYTHQGVGPRPRGLVYPGRLKCFDSTPELMWNRAQIKASMDIARKFQRDHHVRIFVGEFSAIRWAPGAAQWLKDAISVFEEYGWDWTYHSYVGWNGWNPTFAADAPSGNVTDGGCNTDRLKVLIAAWAKNRR